MDNGKNTEEKIDPHELLGVGPIHHTRKETRRRIKGIVASASFEDMKPNRYEIHWLKKLGYGKITEEDYDYHFKIMPEEQMRKYEAKKKAEKQARRNARKQKIRNMLKRR